MGKQSIKSGIHGLTVVAELNAKDEVAAVFCPPVSTTPHLLVDEMRATHPNQGKNTYTVVFKIAKRLPKSHRRLICAKCAGTFGEPGTSTQTVAQNTREAKADRPQKYSSPTHHRSVRLRPPKSIHRKTSGAGDARGVLRAMPSFLVSRHCQESVRFNCLYIVSIRSFGIRRLAGDHILLDQRCWKGRIL